MSVRGLLGLRRITSSGAFIPEIDGLRFVAIMSVLAYHVQGYVLERGGPFVGDPRHSLAARAFEHGHYGVELFFVISGFILALPFASHRLTGTKAVSLRAYFLRRLTRLEPPYVVSMLLFFILLVAYVHKSATALTPHLAASLLYVHNIVYGEGSTINPVAWSLEVEIQFYLLVPGFARLFAIRDTIRRRLVIVGLIVAALLFRVFVMPGDSLHGSRSVLNFLQFFLFGFLLADVYLVDWRSKPTPSLRWDVVSLTGWLLLPVLWTSESASRWAFPVVAFVLYCAAFRGRWSRKVFSLPLITTIGGMCYTIYLLHYQIISFIGRFTARWRMSERFGVELLWQLALLGAAILLVCAAYFLLIEKPCMRPDWPARLARWVRQGRHRTASSPGNVASHSTPEAQPSMNLVTRLIRRTDRELKKYSRLRKARREGLVFVEPNFIYRPALSPDSVVIDAGCSYEADFSVCLIGRHGVRAFGVDPTRKHRDALRVLEARYPGRFQHLPCAIAATDGTLTFHESRTNESGSLFADHVNVIHDETTSYDVEALTLSTLVKRMGVETVDILKLDLEGAEYELLERVTADDVRPFRQLFVEFHHHAVSHFGEADTRRLVARMTGFGFRTFSVDDHNYLFYRDP